MPKDSDMTFFDHLASIVAGAVMALFAVLVITLLVRNPETESKPMTNDEVIEATRHCERNGLATRFEHTFDGRATGYHCGSER